MSDKKLQERPGKYHQPKNITPIEPGLTLNENGLPLRPNKPVCPHFSRFGLCKSGPTCKFDHSSSSSRSKL
ncbi:PREDICTED: zinc finger CCCH domain-containing protein 13-like [Camelina sativa]|uniref:Zinc finger CCCH domain-containing protein 13-like n=1 Tax=Camelina sativa TaxID=90675 RepID=A0ABM0YFZ4_CAMSA|nr:PREDICTED: zinc finger CCCH domain-containing protein 13-like [Camelina sativa]